MKLEVFFDYICPYCYRGQKNLDELVKRYPKLDIIWRPCESHPRPEPAKMHSDLAIEGMYVLQEAGGDVDQYHHLVYEAYFDQGKDISDPAVLAKLGSRCGAERQQMEQALREHRYRSQVLEENRRAWEECGLAAVPGDRAGKRILGSMDGIMVSMGELERFVEEAEGKVRE